MDELLDTLGQGEGVSSYLVLALCAALEYVFPPFPGDAVTLFGAFLITARGWNAGAVMAAVLLGSLLGATVDYYIGVGLARDRSGRAPRTWLGRYWRRAQTRTLPLVERLRERGASYIVVNRFLPGIRAFFFVAAGMARLPLRAVLFYAGLSALLWNLLIIGAGAAVGASWERLRALGQLYTTVAWVVVVAVGIGLLLRYWRRRRRERAAAGGGGSSPPPALPDERR